jgi:hypothetical protein
LLVGSKGWFFIILVVIVVHNQVICTKSNTKSRSNISISVVFVGVVSVSVIYVVITQQIIAYIGSPGRSLGSLYNFVKNAFSVTNITRTIGVTCWYFFADQLLKLALQGLDGAVSLSITLAMPFPNFFPFCVTDGDNLINDREKVLELLQVNFNPLFFGGMITMDAQI